MGQLWCVHPGRARLTAVRAFLLAALCMLSGCGANTAISANCFGGEAPRITDYTLQATDPVLVDGIVFVGVMAYESAHGGPGADSVRRSYDMIAALRPSDGTLLWQRPDPTLGVTNLSVARGMLIVNSSNRVVAMRPSDGTVLWQLARGSESYQNWAPPAFDQETLYASDGLGLYAARLSDGQLLWQLPSLAAVGCDSGLCPGYSAFSRPLVAGGTVFVGAMDGPVAAVRAADGAVLWQTFVLPASTGTGGKLGRTSVNVAPPVPTQTRLVAVAGGHLYVWGEHALMVLRTDDGRLDGLAPGLPRTSFIEGLVIDGTPYFGVTEVTPDQTMYSLRTTSGMALWHVRLDSAPGTMVAADGGVIYVGGGRLFAIRLSDGEVHWRSFEHRLPTVAGSGHLYMSQSGHLNMCIPSRDQLVTVTGLREDDGSVSWRTQLNAMP